MLGVAEKSNIKCLRVDLSTSFYCLAFKISTQFTIAYILYKQQQRISRIQ